MNPKTPIGALPSVGQVFVRRLERLNIKTVDDLINHFPFRYDDFTVMAKIATLQEGEVVTVQGKIVSIKNEYTARRRFLQKARVKDDTGEIDIIWFNQTFLTKTLPPGTTVNLSGRVDIFKKALTLVSPDYEALSTISRAIHTGRLVPIYPETYGVSSKWLRRLIAKLLPLCLPNMKEYLPADTLTRNDLIALTEALSEIHFPQTKDKATQARQRLAFDELFLIQLKALLRKKEWEEKRTAKPLSIAKFRAEIISFWEKLPFELTDAQKQAVKEIFADLAKKKPMNRLLEGDVGSGKTVVAAIGMYISYLNGYQSALMAPTQILAEQHFNTISSLLTPLGVKVGLITGSSKYHVSSSMNKKIHDTKNMIQNTDILIGTHALLSENVAFDKLAFIVIDEQHRFGVEQRGLLLKKSDQGATPHILTMTATPIPRTVALTMYGNLDLSYLSEMPKGRIPVKTWLVKGYKRDAAYDWIRNQISKEHAQVFIICPFIEESESVTTVKAATKEYKSLQNEVFQKQRVGLLHGRMKAKEKTRIMEAFRCGELDILVATPVVEVGIDIPGATIIVIEDAERFGLAQLHQLRGRVGRSDKPSYCLLFTETESYHSEKRLKSLERIFVGSILAELDLALRGPGELTGTRQHGVPALKIATFADSKLISASKKEAKQIVQNEDLLKQSLPLQEKLKNDTIRTIEPN